MKKGFAVILSIIVIAIVIFFIMHRKLSDFEEQHNNLAYTYEVSYMDEKWPLLTEEEKYLIANVPMEEAVKMSTTALAETVLNNPFFREVYEKNLTSSTFDSEKRGFQSRIEELVAEFQFLEEFFDRDDAEEVLGEYIEKVDMENADVKNMQHYIAKHMYSYLLNQNEGSLHSK